MNKTIFSFEELDVWKNSMSLSKDIYNLIRFFPAYEKYALSDQLRRASVSVSLNIAEGKGRHHNNDFRRFLFTSRGSLFEVVTCLKLAYEFQYIDNNKLNLLLEKCEQIFRQLNGLIAYLSK